MIPLNGDYLRASIKDISPEQKKEILRRQSRVSGRSIEDLAEAAIAETALMSIPPHLRGAYHLVNDLSPRDPEAKT